MCLSETMQGNAKLELHALVRLVGEGSGVGEGVLGSFSPSTLCIIWPLGGIIMPNNDVCQFCYTDS